MKLLMTIDVNRFCWEKIDYNWLLLTDLHDSGIISQRLFSADVILPLPRDVCWTSGCRQTTKLLTGLLQSIHQSWQLLLQICIFHQRPLVILARYFIGISWKAASWERFCSLAMSSFASFSRTVFISTYWSLLSSCTTPRDLLLITKVLILWTV